MKFLILLVLMFSLPRLEAQTRGLQRITSHGAVQKILRGGGGIILCLGLLSSCTMPAQLNSNQPEALNQSPASEAEEAIAAEQVTPPFVEHAPPEDFQPAQIDNPYTIKVYHRNGFGGIQESDVSDYMETKDDLPTRFYKDMIIHYSRGDDNFIGIAQLNKINKNVVNVIDMEHDEVSDTISTNIIEGVFITTHDDYGDYYVKFPAMHMQKLMGKKRDEFGWSNLLGKTQIVVSSGYHLVRVHARQISAGKFLRIPKDERFWALVPSNYVGKIGR